MNSVQKNKRGKINITLEVDQELADLYKQVSKNDLEKINFLLCFLLYKSNNNSLLNEDLSWNKKEINKIRKQAEENGFNDTILKSILKEK